MILNSLRKEILARTAGSASFRARLLEDPHAAIKEETGATVPEGFSIAVHDDPVEGLQVVVSGATSLSDEEMADIVGGSSNDPWYPFNSEAEANAAWQEDFPGTTPPWANG